MAVGEVSRASAVAAFVASYVGLALGRVPGFRIDRTGVAIIGAAVMVASGAVPWADAVASVDARLAVHYPLMWKTIAATGLMLVAFLAGVPIAIVAIAGAAWTLFTRRVNPEKVYRDVNWSLLVLFAVLLRWAAAANLQSPAVLTVAAAALSNIVSNVPAVLLLKPLLASFDEPQRAWLVLAMGSTLAGNLTILGSVANLIVVEAARAARVEIGFLEYCRVGVPVTVMTLLIGWLMLAWFEMSRRPEPMTRRGTT